jgi:hypothetical protein
MIEIMIQFSYFYDVNMKALWLGNGLMLGLEWCNYEVDMITLFLGKGN